MPFIITTTSSSSSLSPSGPFPTPHHAPQLSPLHAAILQKLPSPAPSPILTVPSQPYQLQYPYPASPSAPSAARKLRQQERERYFSDPYGTPLKRFWLLFETTFGLSVLEPWEKVVFLSILLVLLGFLTLGLWRLPGNALFLAKRARFYLLGEDHANQLAQLRL